MLTRHGIFQDLVKRIFEKQNIRLNKDNIIVTDGNQVTEASYTPASLRKFAKIFALAFEGTKIIKDSSAKPENEKHIEYDTLIENSFLYFEELLEIKIDEKRLNSITKTVKGKMFCHAFTEILLPFIFDGNDKDKSAELEFKKIINDLKSYFGGFELGYITHSHAKANDVEKVNDSKYKHYIEKEKDLYAVPIDRSAVERDIIVPIHIAAINIGVKPDDNKAYSLESLIGNYQSYPFNEEEPFIDPFEIYIDYSLSTKERYDKNGYFSLSPVVIPTQFFIPRFFYYITPINDDIINEYKKVYREYGDGSLTHEELDKLIQIRAVKDYRNKHYNEIAEYYEHVVKYLEDIIQRITTADYNSIIRKDSSDVEICQDFTKHFNIDYERIICYMDNTDCVLKCYELIERELDSFITSFESCIPKLTEDLRIFLPYDINHHYDFMGKILKSSNLFDAMKLREKIINESNINVKKKKKSNKKRKSNKQRKAAKKRNINPKSSAAFNWAVAPMIWKSLEETSYSKENLYKRIVDVLNNYYDNLQKNIRIINREKKGNH